MTGKDNGAMDRNRTNESPAPGGSGWPMDEWERT